MRIDGRRNDEIRPVKIIPNYLIYPEGSVLIEMGNTKVICNASVEEKIPQWLKGQEMGWVSAEYSMLPRATEKRNTREAVSGKLGGRTHEIQRLIGRALRSVTNLKEIGERTIWLDCDVLQADGGTRTAAITGSYVAMVLAFRKLKEMGKTKTIPVTDWLAAISVGKLAGKIVLDLPFSEDVQADVDMNIVMTNQGQFVEVQGTSEGQLFDRQELELMLEFGEKGIRELITIQRTILGDLL